LENYSLKHRYWYYTTCIFTIGPHKPHGKLPFSKSKSCKKSKRKLKSLIQNESQKVLKLPEQEIW
jgi:hypothetical protein